MVEKLVKGQVVDDCVEEEFPRHVLPLEGTEVESDEDEAWDKVTELHKKLRHD